MTSDTLFKCDKSGRLHSTPSAQSGSLLGCSGDLVSDEGCVCDHTLVGFALSLECVAGAAF